MENGFSHQPGSFGILFDIDGVLARGFVPLQAAKEAFQVLLKLPSPIPTAFVTNANRQHSFKAKQLTEWLHTQVSPSQIVMAPTPLKVFTDLHQLHCLLIGQGPIKDIAAELGFDKCCTMEEISSMMPHLDVVDHEKRAKVATSQIKEVDFPKVEAIVLLGEPRHWETPLQLLIDLLLTNGKPSSCSTRQTTQTLPVYACNLDFQYMHRASFPRYAHGAFLLCLEALFKKQTGQDLVYSLLAGKPSELTFRYSEHLLSTQAAQASLPTLKTIYMIGDNLEVDIYGANLYNESICRSDQSIPESRTIPENVRLLPQTAEDVCGVLVRTGVYKDSDKSDTNPCLNHRDFSINGELLQPSFVCDDVLDAVQWILNRESNKLSQ